MSELFSPAAILAANETGPVSADALPAGALIVDVRTAGEFIQGTIPGAINLPLFDEDERAVVGTIYRHGGQALAIDTGLSLVAEKIHTLLAGFAPYRQRTLVICCARGGMRSRSVVNLLSRQGFRAVQLAGGYKRYRQGVMDRLAAFAPRLIVIHGLTGTGKTRLLHKLDHSIDLEAMADHRSSLFGGLDRTPATQRSFESRLAARLVTLGEQPYFIEGESRKIGRVFIPKPLAMAMKQGVLIAIHCTLKTRVRRIIEDYPVNDQATRDQVEAILHTLRQRLGAVRIEQLCRLLHDGDIPELVRILLVEYYDRRYGAGMAAYRYSLELDAEDLDAAAARLTAFRGSLGIAPDESRPPQ